MISWLVKAAHVLMSSGFAILCVAMGIYLIVEPMADRVLASRALGLFGIAVGAYWFVLMQRAR